MGNRNTNRLNDRKLIEQARKARQSNGKTPTARSTESSANDSGHSRAKPFVAGLIVAAAVVAFGVGQYTKRQEQNLPTDTAGAPNQRVDLPSTESRSTLDSIEPTFEPTSIEDPELAATDAHNEEPVRQESTDSQIGPPDPFDWITIVLRRGDTVFGALRNSGVSRAESNAVVSALASLMNIRSVRPDDQIEVQLFGQKTVVAAVFRPNPLTEYQLVKMPNGDLAGEKVVVEPEIRLRAESITITTSLAADFSKAKISSAILFNMADLFAWSIDFSNAVQPNDQVHILWEELWVNGSFYRSGRILFAHYDGKVANRKLYHFSSDKKDAWFHENGRSVRAAFLRAPLEFSRISSRYTLKRFHPVLKRNRPHRGIDFAAPTGTPVYSVADGVVIGAGVMGGAGKAVRVRHNNGWISSYSHLHKILVRSGQRVRQKQNIGLVGSTGLSTGPHLDYRMKVNGQFVNPLKIKLPKGKAVPKNNRAAFEARIEQLQQDFEHISSL